MKIKPVDPPDVEEFDGVSSDVEAETIVWIVVGNTILIGNETIRLALMNASERDDPDGPASAARLKELCTAGSSAVADVDDPQIRDRYGRLVAVVSWFNVNEAMIADGYADL